MKHHFVLSTLIVLLLSLLFSACRKTDTLTYTEEQTAPNSVVRRYYIGERVVGESWNYHIDDYQVDVNGDGTSELVANCMYSGDGYQELRVYDYTSSAIQLGMISRDDPALEDFDDWGANAMSTRYDSESGMIKIMYSAGSHEDHETRTVLVGFDHLVWTEWTME